MAAITVGSKLSLWVQNKMRRIYSLIATGTVEKCLLQNRLSGALWALRSSNFLSSNNVYVTRCHFCCTRLRLGWFAIPETVWSSIPERKQFDSKWDGSNRLITADWKPNRPRRCKYLSGCAISNLWLCGFSRDFCTSTAALPFSIKKACLSSYESKKFYFDTHAVVRLLEDNVFDVKAARTLQCALKKEKRLQHEDCAQHQYCSSGLEHATSAENLPSLYNYSSRCTFNYILCGQSVLHSTADYESATLISSSSLSLSQYLFLEHARNVSTMKREVTILNAAGPQQF
ncbi:uncharacterized protein LOC122796944 [Protopterus annectens]|uniref:uncharacterized protein LOC122796944 n=1 Tax=Protopterus annectens TaxID=7888 RepID=UPI001CFAD128|nr:uncharacterized protein LOC122796944 [Protopterus annectens]